MKLVKGKLVTKFQGENIIISPPRGKNFTEGNLAHAKVEICTLTSVFNIENFLFKNIIVNVKKGKL